MYVAREQQTPPPLPRRGAVPPSARNSGGETGGWCSGSGKTVCPMPTNFHLLYLPILQKQTNKSCSFYVLNFITNYSARRNSCQHTAAISLNDNSTSYFFTVTTSNIPISSLSKSLFKSSFFVSVL